MNKRTERLIKPTKAWAVVNGKGRILDVRLQKRFALDHIQLEEVLADKTLDLSVTPVLITPVGRKK